MDMALILHAVYKLKDRVGSCDDARARDADVVRSHLARQQREEGRGHGGKEHEEEKDDSSKGGRRRKSPGEDDDPV